MDPRKKKKHKTEKKLLYFQPEAKKSCKETLNLNFFSEKRMRNMKIIVP